MKRFLLGFVFIFFLLTSAVSAKTITVKVVALDHFSTEFPISTFNVKVIESEYLGDGTILRAGTIVAGNVVKVIRPRRLKRNAYFEFTPTLFAYNGELRRVDSSLYTAQVIGHRPIDPKKVAIYAARKATNLIFIGASTGVAFVQGLTEAEEGARFKSGLVSAYKDTPISYFEVGSELNIETGDILILKLKSLK